DHLLQTLRSSGASITQARQEICRILVNVGGHITADQLAEKVKEENPNIGRMTVYRTLELLTRLGAIRPVYQGTGAAHYVIMQDGHHHHLVCSNCNMIIEVDDCLLDNLEISIGKQFNFKIQGHLLEWFGLCDTCQ
ncbi:MAG: transcriptional repressor, partial [Chloroflexota bacterium]